MLTTIRGAVTVEKNTKEDILASTKELILTIAKENKLIQEDVIAMIFTATEDLDAVYPAKAARDLGWTEIGLMCMQEMFVVDSLPMCIRLMVLYNQKNEEQAIHPVYLREAKVLRPDWSKREELIIEEVLS